MRGLLRVAGCGRGLCVLLVLVVCGVGGLCVPGMAGAVVVGVPGWSVSSVSRPSGFVVGVAPGGDSFVVLVTNSGGAASSGVVTVTDQLPEGLLPASGVSAKDELLENLHGGSGDFSTGCGEIGTNGFTCSYSGVVAPGDTLSFSFPVRVTGGPGVVRNVVTVSGGGAPSPSVVETPTTIYADAAAARAGTGFGIAVGGSGTALSSVQAGAHPDLTTTFAVNTDTAAGATAGAVKDVTDDLPPGFAGDLVDTPACSAVDFLLEECPVSTQVGVTTVTIDDGEGNPSVNLQPVYNLAAEPGEVGKIGFWALSFHYEGDIAVRAPGEASPLAGQPGEPYGLKATFYNTTAGTVAVDNVSLTIWGVPNSPSHDALRYFPGVLIKLVRNGSHFGTPAEGPEVPYFSNPTSCGGRLEAAFKLTSWENPAESENPGVTGMRFGPIVGCDSAELWMEPKLVAETTTNTAGAASGLDVKTSIRQTYPDPGVLATSTLKKEVVTLPEGMTINPGAGAGLEACSEAEFAEEGPQYTPGRGCPAASKLGTVRIKTPSIAEEVTGSVYIAQPYENPFGEPPEHPGGTLLAIYLVARAQNRGVLVKTPGLVKPDETTGRLRTTFDELPPLPFNSATFEFDEGANEPLVTPPTCGNYTVTAELTPWANPEGSPLTPEIPPFPITTGCPAGGIPPLNPQVSAGTLNNAAGSYSPLDIKLSRGDGEQEITGFSSQMPPGLTANLTGVAECSEAQVAAARAQTGAQAEEHPACPSGSEIGHTIAEAGVGTVLAQAPGKLYLGAPFQGAPFSIVSVTAAKVGPFDLGTVVVHLPLFLNPETAAVTVGSGAANQIPHIIRGIVIHVRNIRVYVDRSHFILNPTSCAPMGFAATVIGGGADPTNPADNTPATVTDPFQAAECANLAFKPRFSVSTSGKTSRQLGAALHVQLSYPNGSFGNSANIRSVKVNLPKQLPSRLTTLQKACQDSVFAANPAGCPAASIVGHAKAVTPVLPVPLEGPAYFVSHGGEEFPDLIVVLQGYGVTVHLVGTTFIKNGITSSTFKHVPDVPVGSFELTLPEGPFSALAANGNLCTANLVMPTAFTAQNGATLTQSTSIEVQGCPYALRIVHRSVSNHTLTLGVSVPQAGRLSASGKGLTSASGSATGRQTLVLKLKERRAGKLRTGVLLRFTPNKGKQRKILRKTFHITFG